MILETRLDIMSYLWMCIVHVNDHPKQSSITTTHPYERTWNLFVQQWNDSCIRRAWILSLVESAHWNDLCLACNILPKADLKSFDMQVVHTTVSVLGFRKFEEFLGCVQTRLTYWPKYEKGNLQMDQREKLTLSRMCINLIKTSLHPISIQSAHWV